MSTEPIQPSSEPQTEPSTELQREPPKLTYREKRRRDQAKLRSKYPDRKRRGPTRGVKYGSRSNPEEKVDVIFMEALRRVVGDKANEFICDCSNWVKEYCPLNVVNWGKMDLDVKTRLYDKIKGKYNLPETVDGINVNEALKFQCSTLYKHWRFRLKERHFRGKTVTEAVNNVPDNIDKDQWTWLVCEYWNSDKQKLNEPPPAQQNQNEEPEGSSEPLETQQEPLYIRLFEKTKKHKTTGWEPESEKAYEELKKLHASEVEKHGKDTLSVQAAYLKVSNNKSGYVKGLGPGVRPPKRNRMDRGNNEVRDELSAEIDKLKNDATQREVLLVTKIEALKASNEELRTSNDELVASNDELKAALSRMNIENIKREKKLRDDMMQMFEKMRNSQ